MLLEGTPAIFREMLGRLPESLFSAELDRGWSPKQVLAHMVDTERVGFHDRLKRMIEEDSPAFETIDVMARMEASAWQSWLAGPMLDELACYRAETCDWLRTLSDEQLQRVGRLEGVGEVTVTNVLHYWPTHDVAHIRQVQRMLMAVLGHEMGAAKEWDV